MNLKPFKKIFPDSFPKWLWYDTFPTKYEQQSRDETTLLPSFLPAVGIILSHNFANLINEVLYSTVILILPFPDNKIEQACKVY